MLQRGTGLAIVTFCFVSSAPPEAAHLTMRQASDARILRVELVVFRGLDDGEISLMKREVAEIWAAHEVTIDWSGEAGARSVRVVIDRPAAALRAGEGGERWAVAGTRVVDGRVTPPVYVSVDAAERVVRAANPPYSSPTLAGIILPRVVGRAPAHEIAHVLLDTRVHSSSGLLRARFTADDFVSPIRDAFELDRTQLTLARRHPLLVAVLQ
jgi:hypothetical protein